MEISENQAVHIYAEMFTEILNLPQVQDSRKALEGQSVVEIIKHALERQYIHGGIDAVLELK